MKKFWIILPLVIIVLGVSYSPDLLKRLYPKISQEKIEPLTAELISGQLNNYRTENKMLALDATKN